MSWFLLDRRPLPGGVRLTLVARDGTAQRPRDLVRVGVSPFLTMELRTRERRLELDITGPDEAEPIIAEFFA